MGDTWIVDLEHMLDENGSIAAPKRPARKLAEHIVAIVAMASSPEIIPLPEYQVRCRRRPGRKLCPGINDKIRIISTRDMTDTEVERYLK
jgi:hypothetical protein